VQGASVFCLLGWGNYIKVQRSSPSHLPKVLNLERFITGGQIVKWNSNYGYINFKETCDAVQAFSHWTWHVTGGELMVCDIQGLWDEQREQYTLFDPAVHAPSEAALLRFGATNLGEAGIRQFFITHNCNHICKHLKLKRHEAQP
jgi:hypothetical protein